MKIGRNDPCPCGSGKKYKKCCLKPSHSILKIKSYMNSVYATIKDINNDLINKANREDYQLASFEDAMNLAITSNALSLIKGFMQNNCCSITNAFNMRNILEHYVFILMNNAGDISDMHKELFNIQYKLIEYNCYNSNNYSESKNLIDIEQLENNYSDAIIIYAKYGYSESKAKKFAKTRAPFMCNEKFNFNELFKKYLPDFEPTYIALSQLIHPSTYYSMPSNEQLQTLTLEILLLVHNHYNKETSAKSSPFYTESSLIYGPKELHFPAQQLYDIQQAQWCILLEIADKFKDPNKGISYVEGFLRQLACIIHDINTDSQLGYTENPKLKFKVIAEMFACFDRTYFNGDIKKGEASYLLMNAHEIYKAHEFENKEPPPELFDKSYEYFKIIHPDSTVAQEDFVKAFKTQNGFLLNVNAKTISLSKLVSDYLCKLYEDDFVELNGKSVNLFKLNKILYLESQYMSHGCGYLYFANQGAWMEDINVIAFLDTALIHMLSKFKIFWGLYSIDCEENKEFAQMFEKMHKRMVDLVAIKKEIMRKNPRIIKPF